MSTQRVRGSGAHALSGCAPDQTRFGLCRYRSRFLRGPRSGSLQAPAAGSSKVDVAELFLRQISVVVDDLVEEVTGPAVGRAEDIGALVTILKAARVVPSGHGVRVGDGLHDLVARGAYLDVGVR